MVFVAPASRRLSGWASRPPRLRPSSRSLLRTLPRSRRAGRPPDSRRDAGATPTQSAQSSCTARLPASAGSGTGRTHGRSSYQTRAPHRGQFLLQALKHRVRRRRLCAGAVRRAASTSQSQMRTERVFFLRNAERRRQPHPPTLRERPVAGRPQCRSRKRAALSRSERIRNREMKSRSAPARIAAQGLLDLVHRLGAISLR